MSVNVNDTYREMMEKQQQIMTQGDELLEERLESLDANGTMEYCRVAAINRYEMEDADFAACVASFYGVVAKLGIRMVMLWQAHADYSLTCDIGVEKPCAVDVCRALTAQVRGVSFTRSKAPAPGDATYQLWGLEGMNGEHEIPGIDSALTSLKPGCKLALVLNPVDNVGQKLNKLLRFASYASVSQNMNVQESGSRQQTRSESTARSTAETNINTRMRGKNTSDTRTQNSATSHSSNAGTHAIVSLGRNSGVTEGASIAEGTGTSTGITTGTTTGVTSGTTTGTSNAVTEGGARTVTGTFAGVTSMLKRLQRRVGRYMRGRSVGMVNAAIYAFAPAGKARVMLAQINSMMYPGEGNADVQDDTVSEIRHVGSWDTLDSMLHTGAHPAGFGCMCLPREVPCFLPFREQPGMNVELRSEYARNILFHRPDKVAAIRIGAIVDEDKMTDRPALLDANEMTAHALFIGATGCGKSTAISNTVCQIQAVMPHVHFLAIDPKDTLMPGDYLNGATLYHTRTDSNANVLRLQPFAVPEGVSLSRHIDRLNALFQSCWPLNAAMPDILLQALASSYQACGWDLARGVRLALPHMPKWPNFTLLEQKTREIINSGGFSERLRADYEGALCTRLHTLSTNFCAEIFRAEDATPFEELFDRNVIIHCGSLSGETLGLTMSILLLQMTEYRQAMAKGRRNLPLQHICIFEEAHHLAPRTQGNSENPESVSIGGKTSEAISMLLAEARDKGECCILSNQTLHDISQCAVDNTATKCIFQIAGKDDLESVSAALALNNAPVSGVSQTLGVARMNKYEALLYQRGWDSAPVKIHLDNNALAQNGPQQTTGSMELRRAWNGKVIEALVTSRSVEETAQRLQPLLGDQRIAPQLRQDVHDGFNRCMAAPEDQRPALARRMLLPIFGDLPGLAARIYGKDQDQVFATVRDNLTCYADVSALPVQARNHLAQELLVGYHEGCRKA